MSTTAERKAYLKEHLRYEIQMLHYAFAEMTEPKPQLQWNSVFDSFVMHARNLIDFLSNKAGRRGNNFKAADFTQDYEPPSKDTIRELYDQMHADVFHLGKMRPTDESKKINTDRARELYDWIKKAMPILELKLTSESKLYWHPELAVLRKENIGITFGPNTAPTRTSASYAASSFVEGNPNPKRKPPLGDSMSDIPATITPPARQLAALQASDRPCRCPASLPHKMWQHGPIQRGRFVTWSSRV
jgi:hypothetical protein